MRKRSMIELIDKEDAISSCKAEVWEGEALADIEMTKPVLAFPENPTNGDVIKAMFPNEEYKEGFRGDIVDGKSVNHKVVRVNGLLDYYVMDYDWWNAPYKKEDSDEKADTR